MLPLLRIIPVGGVAIAVLILVLAMSPPRDSRQAVTPEMVLARGSLIDRRDHPEWPQFLVRAAFRRADEMLKLRELPDTPMRIAPVALPPERPPIVAVLPVPVQPPTPVPAHEAAASAHAAPASDAPISPTPPAAAAPPMQMAKLSGNVDDAKVTPAPPATTAALDAVIDTPASDATGDTPAKQTPAAETIVVPSPTPSPTPPAAAVKLAVLPLERPAVDPDRDDITGTVGAENDGTMPVEIGEASSTELPVVLPRERPPILRIIEREQSSRLRRHPSVRRAKGNAAARSNEQPASQVNLFEALFASTADDGRTAKAAAARPGSTTASGLIVAPAYPPVSFYPFTAK